MFRKSRRIPQLKTSPKLSGGKAHQFGGYLKQTPRRKKIFNGAQRRKQKKYFSYLLLGFVLIGLIILGFYLAYS